MFQFDYLFVGQWMGGYYFGIGFVVMVCGQFVECVDDFVELFQLVIFGEYVQEIVGGGIDIQVVGDGGDGFC